ncbi:MAG TPA: hypothetical protein PLA97_08835 [Rubrivivax sp.]|nr:hypothetical protein [Rubrivivax sp.]
MLAVPPVLASTCKLTLATAPAKQDAIGPSAMAYGRDWVGCKQPMFGRLGAPWMWGDACCVCSTQVQRRYSDWRHPSVEVFMKHVLNGLVLAALASLSAAVVAGPILMTGARAMAGHSYGVGADQTDQDSALSGVARSRADAAWSGAQGEGVGAAEAMAAFGSLGVLARGQWLGGDGIGNGGARASFEDEWTIDSQGLTGSAGTLYVTVHVDGTRLADWPYTGVGVTQGYECLASGSGCALDFSSGGGTGTFGFGVPFVYGTPFTYILAMNGQTAADKNYPSSSIDFLHTAVVSGLDVRDASNRPVSGFALRAASGHDYLNRSAVAEPGTVSLLVLGVAGLGLGRWSLLRLNPLAAAGGTGQRGPSQGVRTGG